MNQTTNYQLSQWEASDRILMDDFNSDNAKIDGALAGHDTALINKADAADVAALETRLGLQSIQPTTLSITAGTITLGVGGIDWSQWACVHMVAKPAQAQSGFRVFLNGFNNYTLTTQGVHFCHLAFWPLGNSASAVNGLCFCDTGKAFSFSNLTFAALNDVTLYASSTGSEFLSNSQLLIYGQPM